LGDTGHWVVARGASRLALRRLHLRPAPEECAPGWRYAYGTGLPHDLADLVLRAASAGDGVAVGACVHDTGHAQVVAVGGGRLAKLAIGPDRAEEPPAHDPEGFAHWSWCTPRPLSDAEAEEISHRAGTFADETAEELFDQLGLPAPYDPFERRPRSAGVAATTDETLEATTASVAAQGFGGYLAPLGFMSETTAVGGRRTAWRDLRHVPGLGEGFLGIWDRESPEEPVATFVVSRRGEMRLREQLERFQSPGGPGAGRWYERFGRVDDAATISGECLLAAVFDRDEVAGVVVAAGRGHEGVPAAYLVLPGDGIRHLCSLESLRSRTTVLERLLGEAELSEWIPAPSDSPDDLGSLAPVVLGLAGLEPS
jgi:hypothetical protein